MWLDRLLGVLSATVLFAMMVMTFADVTGRYLFDRPLAGSYELTQVGLALLIFSALPLVTSRSEHVEIDFINSILSNTGRRILTLFVELLGFVVMVGVAIAIAERAGLLNSDGLRTEALRLPLSVPVYVMAICSALTSLVFLRRAWRVLLQLMMGGLRID